jgi:4,5:9,10-diseco-3-hydroxy-5,9,17-trioxoandrosta-1(10),2-diene-4-oate hydrolase
VLEAPAPIRSDGSASQPEAPAPAGVRLRRDADLDRRLREVTTPTLVVFGTLDDLAPPEMGRMYKEVLPNAHLVFVYDAGHAISADRPDAFAEVVNDFLERHEAFVISRAATVIHP